MQTASFIDVESMLTDTTMDMLSNATVTPALGAPFRAILSVDNVEFFDGVKGVDYVLRYAGPNVLSRGDRITISGAALVADGTPLHVSEKPRVLHSGHEFIAPLAGGGV